jgi:hypothetical protein
MGNEYTNEDRQRQTAERDTVSFVQEIRSKSPDYSYGAGVWLPQAMKNHPSPVIASEAKQSPGR